ncbi:MAG: proteasome subunit alpha [Myxococcota bacterium]
MSASFYVSPEQVMQDKAEYARKGISRGKSSLILEYDDGMLLMAENTSSLAKIGEIYDRIAFAGVGKFSEFDHLRKIGVRYADVKGYSYSRDDVRAKALANAYSQTMGEAFTREPKPLEVEIVVAEVGNPQLASQEESCIYRVQFDGSISDHVGYCVIGGGAEDISNYLRNEHRKDLALGETLSVGQRALQRASEGQSDVPAENLEVCVLEKARTGRKFRRLSTEELVEYLSS